MEDSDHQDYIEPLERDIERLEKELKRMKEKFDVLSSCLKREVKESENE